MGEYGDKLLQGANEADPRKRGVRFVGPRITRGSNSGQDTETFVFRSKPSCTAFDLGAGIDEYDLNGGAPTGFASYYRAAESQKANLGDGQSLNLDIDLGYDPGDGLMSEAAAFEDPDYRFPRDERGNPYGEVGKSYAPEGFDGLEDSVPNRMGEDPEWAELGEEVDQEHERQPSGAIPFIDFEKGLSDGTSEYPADDGLRMSLPPGERDIDRGDDWTSHELFFTEPDREQFGEDEGYFDFDDGSNRRQTQPRTQGSVNPNSTFARRRARMKANGFG